MENDFDSLDEHADALPWYLDREAEDFRYQVQNEDRELSRASEHALKEMLSR